MDLRRYLPERRGSAICNLSSYATLSIGSEVGGTLAETVQKVRDEMRLKKARGVGLPPLSLAVLNFKCLPFSLARSQYHRVMDLMARTGSPLPIVTNMGAIDPERLLFGEVSVQDAFLTAPLVHPPFSVVGASGFSGSLTLSAGFCESGTPRHLVEELLDRVEAELRQGA